MIKAEEISPIGKVVKTHGVAGELSVAFDIDYFDEVVEKDACLIFDIDGIFVPFFVAEVRPRGASALLVKLDGEDTQERASAFVGKTVYMNNDVLGEEDEEDDGQLYASDLVGFNAVSADGATIGEITGYDDSTDNPLFHVTSPVDHDKIFLIPIADEFITDIDTEDRKVTFSLPDGLLDL